MARPRRPINELSRLDRAGRTIWATEGRRLVAEMSDATRREAARKANVSIASISAWACGISRPSFESAAVLEDVFGIPMRAWTMPAYTVEFERLRSRLAESNPI